MRLLPHAALSAHARARPRSVSERVPAAPHAGFSATVRVQYTPALVYSPASEEERVVAAVSGNDHVLLLTAAGRVLSFGCAEVGRLGRLEAAQAEIAIRDAQGDMKALMRRVLTPAPVPGLPKIKAIGAVRLLKAARACR